MHDRYRYTGQVCHVNGGRSTLEINIFESFLLLVLILDEKERALSDRKELHSWSYILYTLVSSS